MPERRAFICVHQSHEVPLRRFLSATDPTPPRCPEGHGRMIPQTNVPYVKPDPNAPIGKPKRVAGPKRAKRAK